MLNVAVIGSNSTVQESDSMIRENRQLVTNEPVEVHNCREKFYPSFYRILQNTPQFHKGNRPEDVNNM